MALLSKMVEFAAMQILFCRKCFAFSIHALRCFRDPVKWKRELIWVSDPNGISNFWMKRCLVSEKKLMDFEKNYVIHLKIGDDKENKQERKLQRKVDCISQSLENFWRIGKWREKSDRRLMTNLNLLKGRNSENFIFTERITNISKVANTFLQTNQMFQCADRRIVRLRLTRPENVTSSNVVRWSIPIHMTADKT